MNISELKVGTLLEIYIRRDGYNYKVVSKIEYVDEERVGVTPIASRMRLFRFKDSDIVDIVYRTDIRSWKWSHVRAGIATLKDGTKLHIFVPKGESEVFNRRTTYRLPMGMEIDISYEVVDNTTLPSDTQRRKTPELLLDETLNEISERYREYTCRAFLKDLSEGGAAIASNTELKKGDIVSFELPFGQEHVSCRAVVVRVTPGHDAAYSFGYGLNYIETSSNYVPYFYAEQRHMLSENRREYGF